MGMAKGEGLNADMISRLIDRAIEGLDATLKMQHIHRLTVQSGLRFSKQSVRERGILPPFALLAVKMGSLPIIHHRVACADR